MAGAGKYHQPERRPAVVAGASSGIGAETAIALAAAGYPVALGARWVDRCQEIAERIRAEGGEATAAPLDLSDPISVQVFARHAQATLGDVEVVISNVGRTSPGAVYTIEEDRFAAEIDLAIMGAHRLIRAFVPGMVERRRGDFVFVSSDVAVRARPFMSAYAAGKWGLEGMAHALQMELEGTGVRASIVRPGPTRSEMGLDWDPAAGADTIEQWVKFGHARHSHFLKPTALAGAITGVVSQQRGVHINLIEVSPEAPLEDT